MPSWRPGRKISQVPLVQFRPRHNIVSSAIEKVENIRRLLASPRRIGTTCQKCLKIRFIYLAASGAKLSLSKFVADSSCVSP
jgi:hypothetical protein